MSETLLINVSAEQIRALDMALCRSCDSSPQLRCWQEDSVALQLEWPRADDDPRAGEVPSAACGACGPMRSAPGSPCCCNAATANWPPCGHAGAA